MIDDIQCIPLKQISDTRGKVMHMLRATDPYFEQFGEVYFSWINQGVVKAWSKHTVMKMHYVVPVGSVRVVIYDDRSMSLSRGHIAEYILSPENYFLLIIPPGLWYGLQAMGDTPGLVVNCASIPHDPNEIIRIPPSEASIPYQWENNVATSKVD